MKYKAKIFLRNSITQNKKKFQLTTQVSSAGINICEVFLIKIKN